MKTLTCPLNGSRDINEFIYGGEYHPMPDPGNTRTDTWVEYVYFDNNPAGIVIEWWCHGPSNYWFLAERNTVTDDVIRTYAYDEAGADD